MGCAALAALMLSRSARADECCRHCDADRPLEWAGVGTGYFGITAGHFELLTDALRDPALLGPGYTLDTAPLTFGGTGGAILFRRLWVGGSGFSIMNLNTATSRGSASAGMGFGGGELGYAVVNNGHWLVIPYFGFGAGGAQITVTNKSTDAMRIDPNLPIGPGGGQIISAGFIAGQFGVHFHRLVLFGHRGGGRGGLAIGADVGVLASMHADHFSVIDRGQPLLDLPSAGISGGFFHLTLGGAGGR